MHGLGATLIPVRCHAFTFARVRRTLLLTIRHRRFFAVLQNRVCVVQRSSVCVEPDLGYEHSAKVKHSSFLLLNLENGTLR